jgi:membrane protease YdiL (CAAX protease family)
MDTLISVFLVCGIVILANLPQDWADQARRIVFWGIPIMLGLLSFSLLMQPFVPAAASEGMGRSVNAAAAFAVGLLGLAFSGFSSALLTSAELRTRLHQRFPTYDTHSPVHMLALLLALLSVFVTLANLSLSGGTEGMAAQMSERSIQALDLLGNLLLYSTVALCGVGLGTRRTLPQALARLGLSQPTRADLLRGLGYGGTLFFAVSILSVTWAAFDPQGYAQQTSAAQAISAAVGPSLWMGFLLALSASIGEELLFRGALQPIFGGLFSALYFVLLHWQYTATLAAVMIFFVALAFGWLRWRYNTQSAIAAHFVYNFLPFVMLALFGGAA